MTWPEATRRVIHEDGIALAEKDTHQVVVVPVRLVEVGALGLSIDFGPYSMGAITARALARALEQAADAWLAAMDR